MPVDADISLTQHDRERVVVPVEAQSDQWVDFRDVSDLHYVITDERGGGIQHVSYTLNDDAVDLIEASEVDDDEFDQLGVPDTTTVLQVTIPESATGDLPRGTSYHECQIDLEEEGPQTVMTGKVTTSPSATGGE